MQGPSPARGAGGPLEPEPAPQAPVGDGAAALVEGRDGAARPEVQDSPERLHDLGAALPRPGAKLTLLRSYPDGVMAILDERNGRVMFCRLQEVFEVNLDWQPVRYPGRSGTP